MRTATSIVYASVAALVLACSDSTGPSHDSGDTPRPPSGAFQVAPASATLEYGQTLQLTTTYTGKRDPNSVRSNLVWRSSDQRVAIVRNGLVRGIGLGQATIVATWGGYQAAAIVNVTVPWEKHHGHPVCLNRTTSTGERLMAQC